MIAAIGCLFSSLMRFAMSRKREYMADAGSAEMTKNLRVHGYTKEQFDENDWNYVYGSDADKIQKMIEKEPSFAEKDVYKRQIIY